MAKTKTKPKRRSSVKASTNAQLDSVYLLKLVLYLIVGAQWIYLRPASSAASHIPIPIGLIIGLIFATHEHFRLDRKIEFAVLLVAMFVGFWSQVGVYITY